MSEKRNAVIVYRDQWEAVKDLPTAEKIACIDALFTYGLDGEERAETAMSRLFLTMAKAQIDANNRRYESGKKGGRPKKSAASIVIDTPEWYKKQKAEEMANEIEEMKKNV